MNTIARLVPLLHLVLRLAALAILLACAAFRPAWAIEGEGDVTLQSRYFIDESAQMSVQEVAGNAALKLQAMDKPRAFPLGNSALWMRFDLPPLEASRRWYLMLSGSSFINRASLFTQEPGGVWHEQRAGDLVPVAQWPHPNPTPLFEVQAKPSGPVWLRLENRPAPTSPRTACSSSASGPTCCWAATWASACWCSSWVSSTRGCTATRCSMRTACT
jgi:hypothetical protein